MRTAERIGRGLCVLAAVAALAVPAPGSGLMVTGGTFEHRAMARWAIDRFEATGFALPVGEIRFHADREGCHGRSGYYSDGVANLCRTTLDTMAARTLLHELAHGWVEANVTDPDRERFLALRRLATWNGRDAEWDDRGFEHAAEVIAWAIGDQGEGILSPSIPRNSREELSAAYELLTGRPLPELVRRMTWEGRLTPAVAGAAGG